MPTTDWNPLLRDQFEQPYWGPLQAFVAKERSTNTVYPPDKQVFRALHTTPYQSVRVVILGQDPYHGPKQAHGLAFSVASGVPLPPSLRNVLAERENDLGLPVPKSGDLSAWAAQGVLLLNTTLTVRAGEAGSHQGRGWESFTDEVIRVVSNKVEPVVFVLWGASARSKKALIADSRHIIIESAHPSPLSAHRGFFGSRPFSRVNASLTSSGRPPIDWSLPQDQT